MITRVYIAGQRIDLFDKENIEIKSSVSDIGDIQKNTTDFSKTFTVPASATNNKLFKHYYNADINNSFDARVKIKGKIELGGAPFKFGKFRLTKVNVKSNLPYSYTINFVGNLVDLKKKLGKKEISSLDLTAFDHEFNGSNVRTGLTFGLFDRDIIYTLNPKKQYYYNSDTNDNTDTDTIVNIASNGNSIVHGVRFQDLSPSIKIIKILEAIEADYDIVFSRDFFGTTEFTKLYQTITNKKESNAGGTKIIDFDGGDTTNVSLASDTGSFLATATAASNDNVYWEMILSVRASVGYENTPYTITIEIDGQDSDSENGLGEFETFTKTLSVNGSTTFEVRYKVTSTQEFKFTANWQQVRIKESPFEIDVYNTTASVNTLLSEFVIADNMPKIKIIDWLTGLFKAFKLIIIPQEDGSFYVDTLNRYYAKGKIYEATKYIDFESYDVERGELFSEINFNFEQPQTILNKEFEKNTGIAYGDEEVKLTDNEGEPLDGDTYEIKVPFETVVYDRLRNLTTNALTDVMYAPFVDENGKGTFPKINLFYNITKFLRFSPIRFITDNQVITNIAGFVNTAFHSDLTANANVSFLFGLENSEWDGAQTVNNLYTNHHKDFIDGIFNIKRRNFKYKAQLPLNIITKLQLNDILKIKGRFYRIDNFTTNPITGKTNFKLFNSLEANISEMVDGNTTIYFSGNEDENTLRVNQEGIRTNLTDNGYGITWVTVTQTGTNINIALDQNNTGFKRSVFLTTIDATKKRKDTTILILQDANGVTFDNTEITFDSTLITFDHV